MNGLSPPACGDRKPRWRVTDRRHGALLNSWVGGNEGSWEDRGGVAGGGGSLAGAGSSKC